MATIKISELEEVVELTNSDVLPIINENETKKVSFEKLMENTATKEYVDNLTTKSKIVKYITWGKGEDVTGDYPADAKTTIGELITESFKNWMSTMCYATITLDGDYGVYTMLEPFTIKSKYLKYIFYEYGGVRRQYNNKYCMIVEGTWNGDNFECTTMRREVRVDYLTKDNTDAYTPTADYHPATKKYVDEHAGSGGSVNVDLSNYYTKSETDNTIKTNLSNYSTTTQMEKALETKQPLLTAGDNITIIDNVISAVAGGSGESTPSFKWDGSTSADALLTFQEWWQYYLDTGCFSPITYATTLNNPQAETYLLIPYNASNIIANSTNIYVAFIGILGGNNQFWSPKFMYFSVRLTLDAGIGKGGKVSGIYKWANWNASMAAIYKSNGSYPETTHSLSTLSLANTSEYTPTADYHPATKKYVDDSIAAVDTSGGSNGSSTPIFSWDFNSTDETVVAMFQEWWNLFKTSGVMYPISKAVNSGSIYSGTYWMPYYHGDMSSGKSVSITFISLEGKNTKYMTEPTIYYKIVDLRLTDTLANNGTVSSISIGDTWHHSPLVAYNPNGSYAQQQTSSSTLPLSNTVEFTPTGDYNPATKKYVDDAITSAITSVMEAEY